MGKNKSKTSVFIISFGIYKEKISTGIRKK